MTRPGAAAVVGAAVFAALAARPAEARLVDLYATGTAGGVTGWGTTKNTPDLFDSTRGAGVGFDLGLKLLFVDVSANFLQVLNGSGTSGTVIQLLLGGAVDVPLGSARLADGEAVQVLQPKLAGGFGFGTPGPAVTEGQVSTHGVVADAMLGYAYFLDPLIALGAQATFGYHYFLGGDAVNGSQGHSSGYHVLGLGTVTFQVGR